MTAAEEPAATSPRRTRWIAPACELVGLFCVVFGIITQNVLLIVVGGLILVAAAAYLVIKHWRTRK